MSESQNWRVETDAQDYFTHQKKQLQVADRRPVIRKAIDIVGPGIGAAATRITDFNDLLATYNGYYAADEGAANAPTADQAYVGMTSMDSEFGGVQVFYGMDTEAAYHRVFTRNPMDSSTVYWGSWESDVTDDDPDWIEVGAEGAPAFQNSWVNYGTPFAPARFRKRAGFIHLDGVVKNGTSVIFTLPVTHRPTYTGIVPAVVNQWTKETSIAGGTPHTHTVTYASDAGRLNVNTDGTITFTGGNGTLDTSYLSLTGVRVPVD